MTRPPFQMRASRRASLTCDGKHIVSGRASFCWETFLMRRAAGVPGQHEIRRSEKGAPWHRIDLSIEEAEEQLQDWGGRLGSSRVKQMRRTRASRERAGLPVE